MERGELHNGVSTLTTRYISTLLLLFLMTSLRSHIAAADLIMSAVSQLRTNYRFEGGDG